MSLPTSNNRVVNFISVASGSNAAQGLVSTGLINPAAGETAADVWNKPQVQNPINHGCTQVIFVCPYGKPTPTRTIRYTDGGDAVTSKFHFDARTMSAALSLTFFEGWETTVSRLVNNYGQRVIGYWGRLFPQYDTTLTPWSWPNDINSSSFQACPGKTNMASLTYIRSQLAAFLDNGGAEFFFDAEGQARGPTAGRYDNIYRISDALTNSGTYTHADYTGSFANTDARVCGLESMPRRSTTEWAIKSGMTWLALANGVNDAFDLRIGDQEYLQPEEMDVMPIVEIQDTDEDAYNLAMSLLSTYSNIRVAVKFNSMLNNGFDMDAMIALGEIGSGEDIPDESGDEETPAAVDDCNCADRWALIPEVRLTECNPAPDYRRVRAPYIVVELFNDRINESWELEDFQVEVLFGQLTRSPRKAALEPSAPTASPNPIEDQEEPTVQSFPFLDMMQNGEVPEVPEMIGEVEWITGNVSYSGGGGHGIPSFPANAFPVVRTFIDRNLYQDGTTEAVNESDNIMLMASRRGSVRLMFGSTVAAYAASIEESVE